MVMRSAWATVLLAGLAGCRVTGGDLDGACLEQHPGDIRCCAPGDHIDHSTCCPAGMHGVPDVEHPEWTVCIWDEVDPGTAADASADGP